MRTITLRQIESAVADAVKEVVIDTCGVTIDAMRVGDKVRLDRATRDIAQVLLSWMAYQRRAS